MNKNKMLSLAAAMVLTTTSAMAFESDNLGVIYTDVGTVKTLSGYTGGTPAAAPLTTSPSAYGDALIYPTYSSVNGWETEIKVTNTLEKAIVAKVVLYSKTDSRELRDFNIYLSAKDVFAFKISGTQITTKDGSFIKSSKTPTGPTALTDVSAVTPVEHENESYKILWNEAYELNNTLDANGNPTAENEQEGYVVIYAMAQATDRAVAGDSAVSAGGTADGTYHTAGNPLGHQTLFNDYRILLDECRTNWASSYQAGGIKNGMYTAVVPAPNVAVGCHTTTEFTDPASDALTGTVRLTKNDGTNSRDMILPAIALQNFTDGQMVLWTEGEYASIADRNIDAGNYLDDLTIEADALAFLTTSATYTYAEGSLTNKLIFTQPMKRILVQLGNHDAYYTGVTYDAALRTTNYGGFQTSTIVYNENEDQYFAPIGGGPIISPISTDGVTPGTWKDEMQVITDIHKDGSSDTITANSGYAEVTVTGSGMIPAIVTQMVGSVAVGNDAQVNWIHAPSKTVAP